MSSIGWTRPFVLCALACALSFAVATPAVASPDYDGDGYTVDDCRPLDPAVHPGALDKPDLSNEDLNCDGIDGDMASAYFVSSTGSDTTGDGSMAAPFATLQKAIGTRIASSSGKDIYVAAGSYPAASIPSTGDGTQIYGGFTPGTWARPSATGTSVAGIPQALTLDSATDVVLQQLTLTGTTAVGNPSAYGIRAVNSSELALIAVSVQGGNGLTGTAGGSGFTPSKPTAAADGATPADCNTPGAGGTSGLAPLGANRGGAGGAGGEETNDGENGQSGSPGATFLTGGTAGAGGVDQDGDPNPPDWDLMAGKDGGPGSPGATGASGGGGTNTLTGASSLWSGSSGGAGLTGGPGGSGGGGGGGAGRGAFDHWAAGPGGGQGGHGGLGGSGGGGGGFGGGSFGVYLFNSKLVVDGSSLVSSGTGGSGGNGGFGGLPGPGGDGGIGGAVRTDCGKTAGSAGNGGQGGDGGTGGRGGGGSGGPSAAIFRAGTTSSSAVRSATLNAGAGGSGGTGTSNGAAGQSGQTLGTDAGASDFDGDGLTDSADSCPTVAAPGTATGCPARPAALPDSDGDGIPDGSDSCPTTAAGGTDANGDGCPDSTGGTGGTGGSTGDTGTSGSTGGVSGSPTGDAAPPASQTNTLTPSIPAQPLPQLKTMPATVALKTSVSRRGTIFKQLLVQKLPPGAKVAVGCKGKGCPRKSYSKSASSKLMLKPFMGKVLKPKTRLTITVSGSGFRTKVFTYTIRAGKKPKLTTA